jgi:tetratricopeptide (TPR) repeat protein
LPGGTVEFGLGLHFLVRGEWERSRELGSRLVALEPLSAIVHVQVGALLTSIGDHDAAAAQLEKALELDPGMPVALHVLGFCRIVQGRLAEGTALARRALEKGWMVSMMSLPTALVRLGERGAALETVRALEETATQRYVTPLIRALAWAALDERERTLDLLAQSEEDRSPLLTLFAVGPGFFALAPDWVKAWVSDLRKRIGLEPSATRNAPGE